MHLNSEDDDLFVFLIYSLIEVSCVVKFYAAPFVLLLTSNLRTSMCLFTGLKIDNLSYILSFCRFYCTKLKGFVLANPPCNNKFIRILVRDLCKKF